MGRRKRRILLCTWTELFGDDKNPAEGPENEKGFVKVRKGNMQGFYKPFAYSCPHA